ncbi:MAG: 2-oxo acid dehydrogenase subunit E2 [Chloroflexi bacterium]|nr:2-oxo acid dehydrogenase subunit E2 [Chloroflexota bacterium]
MRVEVTMPRMGQSMEEGTILNWLKTAGATIKRGEPLFEIESDKATVEVEALTTGKLAEIIVPAGTTVSVGSVVAFIEAAERIAVAAPAAPPREPIVDAAPRRQPISPVARRVAHEHGLDPAAISGTGRGGRIVKEDVQATVTQRDAVPAKSARLDVSPVARKLARQHGLDLAQLVGSAPNGRIIKRDILAAVVSQAQAPSTAAEHRVPLTRLRRIAAGRMTESKSTIPHFYLTLDIDMGRALELRESLKRRGQTVSINDLILKATSLALTEYPTLNATFADGELILNEHINLAVAVAVGDRARPEGLTTPVVHDCGTLRLTEIAAQAAVLAGRARENKLKPDDLSGGTFTVSNLGMYGIRQFQAIINPPQVAILAVGALQKVAVFDADDRVRPVQRLTVTLSADHRATDGAEAAGFLNVLQTALEDAFMLVE